MNDEEKARQALQTIEGDLFDYWRVIWSRRWLIFALVLISAITAYISSKRLPKIYLSTITVIATGGGEGGSRGGLAWGTC